MAAVAVIGWWSLVGRVNALEIHNAEQDARASRIGAAQLQQRSDTTQQLRDISGDVKEIRNYLLNNSAGQRPDVQRWSKP